jgi:lipoprotein-releasing system permease protein
MVPWYLYSAIKQLFPSKRFFSFFSFMSIIGVTLGVAVLIVVQTVMNGFGERIRSTIVATTGEVRIESNGIIYNWPEIQSQLLLRDEIEAVAPYAQGIVMLQHEDRPAFPFIRGVEPDAERRVVRLDDYIVMGSLDDLDDSTVILSEGLAHALGAHPGAVVELYTPLLLERLKADEVLLPMEMEVAGIFRTGWNEIDNNSMLVTLRVMQELYGLEDGVHGLTLKLAGGADSDRIARLLNESLQPPLQAYSWLDSQRDFLFILQLEKTMISFIIIFIILVASFSIAIALMMTVIRKTREIGLLVAMGARPWEVALGFCFQGLVIGLVGTALGCLFAVLAIHYRNAVVLAFAQLTQSEAAIMRFYQFADIPAHYMAGDFIVVTVFALLISTCAGLIPAWRAARLKPAEALRSE